jgi:hypothetical protein
MARPRFLLHAATVVFLALCCRVCGIFEVDGGIFVRLDADTPAAHAADEKDLAFTLLRKWGLGDERKFAELAGWYLMRSSCVNVNKPDAYCLERTLYLPWTR